MRTLLRPRPPLWLWLIALGGTCLSLFAAHQVRQSSAEEALQRFAFTADRVTARIEERLAAYALVLRGAAGLFEASEEVSRDEWRTFIDKLHATDALGNIQGIGYARRISPAELAAHEAEMRAEGLADYRVHPPGQRDTYAAVVHLEPLDERNRRALGYDTYSEPVRRAAMEQARDTGRAALSASVQLVQETDEDVQPGTLMYVPVYRRGAPLDSLAQRRQALEGWVYMPYRMHDLMQGILADCSQGALSLRLYDGERRTPEALLYQSHAPASDPQRASAFSQQRRVDFNGRTWRLDFDHLAPEGAVPSLNAWLTLAAGLTLTGLLCALLLSLLTTRTRALRISDRLTLAIRDREAELASLLERLQTIADRVPGVVYEYRLAPDGRSRFPYASSSMQHVYGVSPDALKEDAAPAFAIIHPDDLDAFRSSIQRSAETLTPWRHEYRVRLDDGRQRWLFGDALPQRESDGSTTWYGVISDTTERKEIEMALRCAHAETERLREALDHVDSPVYMKDADSRYSYANRAALALLGCTEAALIGSDASRFLPGELAHQQRRVDARVLHGDQVTEEVILTDPGGKRRVYLDIRTPIHDGDEIVGLLGIASDITLLKEQEQRLEQLAHHDALTGLPNRALLADRLDQAMTQESRRGSLLALAYLDLDGFKAVNDRHGHAAGDQLLITLSHRLKRVLREGDTLARLGGDEFVAVLRELNDRASATPLLERLLEAAALPVSHEGQELSVNASLGVTFYPQAESMEAEQLLRQADQAMYQAKLAGKGRYHFFDAEHDRYLRSQHESLGRLEQALEDGELLLHYQPKVNLRTGAVVGVEALLRWQHPARGLLLPSSFLPGMEEHALAEALGEWVMRTALAQAAAWYRSGLSVPVSVNIGARQLRQRELPERLGRLLAEHPELPQGMLELEVLETSALGDLALIADRLAACRRAGVDVSLDDFGSGYSSLTYLKRLPAGTIKVDQSFIRDILKVPEDIKILEGVLGLADAFGRRVIAEGVESTRHGDLLLRLGCELGQGHGIARPMPAEAFPDWLANWQPPAHWARLAPVGRARLPLLYASVEHRAWRQQLLAALNDSSGTPALAASACQLRHWVKLSCDRRPFDSEPIRRQHQRIHSRAKTLVALHQRGRQDDAMAQLAALNAMSDDLLAMLEALLDAPEG